MDREHETGWLPLTSFSDLAHSTGEHIVSEIQGHAQPKQLDRKRASVFGMPKSPVVGSS